MSNTTYLCLVLVVLGSPKVSRVRLALLYTASLSLPLYIMHSLASIPLLLILEDKGRPTHGHKKQRVSTAQWKQAFPVLPSLVKMQVGRGNI